MPKKVLFINPRRESVVAYGLPHLGLALLAAVLKKEGHHVLVVDYLLAPNMPSPDHFLRSFSPDIVGISTHTAIVSKVFGLIGTVCDYNQEIPIIVGGPHATLYPEDFLSDGRVSYIMRGEAEERIAGIINSAVKMEPPKIIDCQPIDLGKLPFPDFRCFYGFKNIISYPLSTSRGCQHNCSFCAVHTLFSRTYRWREIGVCCQEIINARKLLPNLKTISVVDDNSTALKERFRNFLLEYIEKINLPLGFCYIRADSIDAEILTLLKKAKTSSVCIIFEHAHPQVYEHIHKGEDLATIMEAARLIKEHGLGLDTGFIIGLPYDTFERTKCSVELAKRLHAGRVYWNMLIPYKGTQVREWFVKNGKLLGEADKTSLVDYSCFCDEPAVETQDMTAEDRKKAYFYAMLETNSYVLMMKDILKDVPRLFITAHKYGLYTTLIKNLIFQFAGLPLRLRGRILRTIENRRVA
jgi:magnesium-protoporphyrin IX monomethyl ester (oxidative) cyclase